MRSTGRLVVSLLGLLVTAGLAQADVVAIKRSSAPVYAGPLLSQTFKDAVTAGTITVYTDASTGQDMVDDTCLYRVNNYEAYKNRGASQRVVSDEGSLWRFNVAALPDFVGGRIVKAELQLYYSAGNTQAAFARVLTQPWAEGNKSGDYPGLAPAEAGASPAHPRGLNTYADQNAAGGTTPPLASWGPSGNQMFSKAGDVSGFEYVGSYAFNYPGTAWNNTDPQWDGHGRVTITDIVQDWAGGLPNYGVYSAHGNLGLTFAEAGGDYEPVLFIQYDRNQSPNTIADLAAGGVDWFQVTLNWTAPDDRPSGTVASYDIRYSTTAFPTGGDATAKDAWWASAVQVPNEPTPLPAGLPQSCTIGGLTAQTAYSFVVRSIDKYGRISDMAAVSATTSATDAVAPAAVNLAIAGTHPNHVDLSWTAPGDDDATGTAGQYDVRYATSPITADTWASATQVAGEPVPAVAGTVQTMRVAGLSPSTQYWFAIKAADEVPNWSNLSNVADTTTPAADTQAPEAIADLVAANVHIKSLNLAWTTPADNGAAGLGGYEIRYSTSPITAENWGSATVIANTLVPAATGQPVSFQVTGLQPDTTYSFAVKAIDLAVPANASGLSNVVSVKTLKAVTPLTLRNPWVTNDRVADCRSISTIASSFVKAFTPDGTVNPVDDEARAINIYNNLKRRCYHWANVPERSSDVTYNVNVFGWGLCGNFQEMGITVARMAGLGARSVFIDSPPYGGHNIYEVQYSDGTWHLYDPMTTMYVYNRANPRRVASAEEIKNDGTILTQAVAEGRACPGFLLCNDDPIWYANAIAGYHAWGGVPIYGLTMNMDLHTGEKLHRTWESWANQFTVQTGKTPWHREADAEGENKGDDADTVNYPYWEPYTYDAAMNKAVDITVNVGGQPAGYSRTYRRWANGTYDIVPDFKSAAYQAMLHGSSNIRTFNDDAQTPELRPAVTGTVSEVVFKIDIPFYTTDAYISGTFVRNGPYDTNKIYYSNDGATWQQVWQNDAIGTTSLNRFSLRTQAKTRFTWYVKVELFAKDNPFDAGVSNLAINTVYEHNKGGMAYLDKGVNNLTFTCDNAAALAASGQAVRLVYKWKEFDGTAWTVDHTSEHMITTSPYNFTINVAGTKVPRTESVLMELVESDAPIVIDTTAPAAIADLAATNIGQTTVDLRWTASGDDGSVGTANRYELRYTTGATALTEANWSAATLVSGTPTPMAAGTVQTFQVTGLTAGTLYHFAIRAYDEVGNVSSTVNAVDVTTAAVTVLPTVGFTAASSSGGESLANVTLPVSLSATSAQTVTVQYAVTGGTAGGNGTDFTLAAGTLTFNPGTTSQNIPLTIVDDSLVEGNETVVVTLSSPSNATLGANTAHTYTILDNDSASLPTVQFQVVSSNGSEGTSQANLVITLSEPAATPITVRYNVTGGTATADSDYQVAAPSVSGKFALKRSPGLAAGGALDSRFASLSDADVATTTVRDSRVWDTGMAAYYNYGANPVVVNWYAGTTSFWYWDLSAYAGGTVQKAQLRLKATNGNTQTIWYAGVKTHAWSEGNQTEGYPGATPGVTWNHPNGTYTGAGGALGWGSGSNAAFDVTADTGDVYTHYNFSSAPAGIAFLVADVTSLVQDWVNGGKPNYGLFAWTGNHGLYTSESAAADQPVLFVDFGAGTGGNIVTIPAGQTTAVVPLTILDDATVESDETIEVTLVSPTGAVLGANTVHTYTITDNDGTPANPGDINGDGAVDVVDLLTLAGSWALCQGDEGYDPACDLSDDNCVDVVDLLILAENWPKG